MGYGKYDKGKETRKKIVKTAKNMFHENGFKKTSITEICRINDIQLGTFTYYFKTKVDLVSEIYAEFLVDAYQAVRETDYEYKDPLQMNIVSNQFYYTASFSCPKCAKFYHEVLENTSIFDYIGKHVRRLYGSYNFHYGLNMDEEDMCDVLLVDSGLRKEFFCYMFNNFGYNLEPKVISKYLRKLNIY